MREEMRTFGYLCPKCGKPVMGARSIFALEASDAEIVCECGESVEKVENSGKRNQHKRHLIALQAPPPCRPCVAPRLSSLQLWWGSQTPGLRSRPFCCLWFPASPKVCCSQLPGQPKRSPHGFPSFGLQPTFSRLSALCCSPLFRQVHLLCRFVHIAVLLQ